MSSKRDDFTKKTVELLGKRVAYLCSNPKCGKVTIGANKHPEKSTTIGIAAHITAAAIGGPRYDDSLDQGQRRHIDNGIWLCSNCATMIDKDTLLYTADLIRRWKSQAEVESIKKLNGESKIQPLHKPHLDVDLILTSRSRSNRGYSNKNPIEKVNGVLVMNLPTNPIIHWEINWNFNFLIHNNSNYPAFNIKIESIGQKDFNQLSTLPKINNLPPLKNFDLKAKIIDYLESSGVDADKVMKSKVPDKFKELKLRLTYLDDLRNVYTDYYVFSESGIKNSLE